MAGGFFGRPFVFNEKCIVFSLICMMLFLYKPNYKNKFILYFSLFIIFVIAYVAMAWYDYYFDCQLVSLRRGTMSFTGLFKPDAHIPEIQEPKERKKKDIKELKSKDGKYKGYFIYLMHLLFIVPIIGYVAYYKKKAKPFIYPTLTVLAIFTAAYHGLALMSASH